MKAHPRFTCSCKRRQETYSLVFTLRITLWLHMLPTQGPSDIIGCRDIRRVSMVTHLATVSRMASTQALNLGLANQ